MGPQLMEEMREQVLRFGTTIKSETVLEGRISRHAPSSSRRTRATTPPTPSSSPRAPPPNGWASARTSSSPVRRRRKRLRHLRRLLLPRQGNRRGGRRRHGHRGSHLPHQIRHQGESHPPPGQASGFQGHAGPRHPNEKIAFHWNKGVEDVLTATIETPMGEKVEKIRALKLKDTVDGTESELPLRACSWPSATSPTPAFSRGSCPWMRPAICRWKGLQPHRNSGRLRLRRRAGPRLPPGHHRRRLRLHGRHRRRTVARRTGNHRIGPNDKMALDIARQTSMRGRSKKRGPDAAFPP